MIDVPVKMARAVKPGPGADKYSAREPFRSIITIWSAVIRRRFVISVGANRRAPDGDSEVRTCAAG